MSHEKEYEKPEVMHDLNPEGIVKLLRGCYAIVGKNYDISDPNVTQALCDSLWKYFGGLWTQTFQEAFQEAAAGALGDDIQRMAPHISIRYISIVLKKYKEKRGWVKNKIEPEKVASSAWYDDKYKFNLFFKHIKFYGSIPVNPDWIALYNFCVSDGLISGSQKPWSIENWKSCEQQIKDLVYAKWGELIHDNNIYKGISSRPLKGLGERTKEYLGV